MYRYIAANMCNTSQAKRIQNRGEVEVCMMGCISRTKQMSTSGKYYIDADPE